MKAKFFFWPLTIFLLAIPAIMAWRLFYSGSYYVFLGIELLLLLILIYLIFFYRRIIRPLDLIASGMDLLREQDFTSRMRPVGQPEADRIVEIFNRMMGELKNERLNLWEQNYLLDLLINASPLGVIILDLDRKIFSVNRAGSRILGEKRPEELTGKGLDSIHHPVTAALLKLEQDDSNTVSMNDAHIYKCTHLSFIDQGFPRSFYLIEPLTEEVFRAEKKAYEKVIRMIAHEVNNTTAGITSSLDTLLGAFPETEKTNETEEIREIVRSIIDRSYKMNRFITNFADVVRIPEPQFREQELNELIRSSVRFLENICRNRNIDVRLELSAERLPVSIDSILMEQVLVNIVKNSAESIEKNGTITIRTSAKPTLLEIIDDGKGIGEEASGKLFSPFFSTKPYGQGIGLIFIREVLQKHRFSFSLQTGNDGLTRFKINL